MRPLFVCRFGVILLFVLAGLSVHAHPDPNEYLQIYSQALAENPNDTEALLQRAGIHLSLGYYADARNDLDRVIELEPDNGDAYTSRAIVALDTGRLEDAAADLAQAVRLQPENPLVHYYSGVLRFKQERFTEAAGHFGRAFELEQAPKYLLARAKAYEQDGRLDDAVADMTTLVELRPTNPSYLVARARLCAATEVGRYEDALADYAKAIELFDKLPEFPIERGQLLARLGREAEAKADFEHALALLQQRLQYNPTSPLLLFARSEVLACLGRTSQALGDLDQVLARTPVESATTLGVDLDEVRRRRETLLRQAGQTAGP